MAETDPAGPLFQTSFARSMRAGAPSEVAYVGYLRIVAAVQATLARTAQRGVDEAVAAYVDAVVTRPHARLLEDCDRFRGKVDDILPAMALASECTHRVMRGGSDPAALIGGAQALEATRRLGASADAIAEALDLTDGGVAFLRWKGDDAGETLAAALATLEGPATEAVDTHREALLTFLKRTFDALDPVDSSALGIHVLAVNPEGGAHPVTQDRRELHAALVATDECLAQLPYIVERYGARGRRFTDSDGAYLAHLLHEDGDLRRKRIRWLSRLLSARGMPTSVLRLHLEIMADALDRAIPSDAESHERLRTEAAHLRDELERRIAPEERRRLATRYAERAAGDPSDPRALEHGELMVDAVCNEADGHRKAVQSLVLWVVDPERASRSSIHAAAELLDEARALADAGTSAAP